MFEIGDMKWVGLCVGGDLREQHLLSCEDCLGFRCVQYKRRCMLCDIAFVTVCCVCFWMDLCFHLVWRNVWWAPQWFLHAIVASSCIGVGVSVQV